MSSELPQGNHQLFCLRESFTRENHVSSSDFLFIFISVRDPDANVFVRNCYICRKDL